jgi:hypothetical protein
MSLSRHGVNVTAVSKSSLDSADHPIRPRQHIRRNRLPILDFRFWILDCSITEALDQLLPEHSGVLLIRFAWPLSD